MRAWANKDGKHIFEKTSNPHHPCPWTVAWSSNIYWVKMKGPPLHYISWWMLQARRVWGPGEGKTSKVHPGSLGLLSPGTGQSAGGIGWLSDAVFNRLQFSTQLQGPFK